MVGIGTDALLLGLVLLYCGVDLCCCCVVGISANALWLALVLMHCN